MRLKVVKPRGFGPIMQSRDRVSERYYEVPIRYIPGALGFCEHQQLTQLETAILAIDEEIGGSSTAADQCINLY